MVDVGNWNALNTGNNARVNNTSTREDEYGDGSWAFRVRSHQLEESQTGGKMEKEYGNWPFSHPLPT